MKQYNNYYDETQPLKPYTESTEANPGSIAPLNALRQDTKPSITPGFWPCLNAESNGWSEVEDHRKKTGYVNGKPFTVAELGPLPEGWSDTPPPPTEEEQYNAERAAIDQEFNGIPYGRVTMAKETLNTAILRGKDEAVPYLREQLELAIQAEAEAVAALEDKYNVYG